MIIRATFPQVYELQNPKNGKYWLVSARSKKWGMNERKIFRKKELAIKHAQGIDKQLVQCGGQVDVPKEKIVLAERYEQLSEKVGAFGLSLEDAVDQLVQYKGDEIVQQTKPFIRDLVEQWKAFK